MIDCLLKGLFKDCVFLALFLKGVLQQYSALLALGWVTNKRHIFSKEMNTFAIVWAKLQFPIMQLSYTLSLPG